MTTLKVLNQIVDIEIVAKEGKTRLIVREPSHFINPDFFEKEMNRVIVENFGEIKSSIWFPDFSGNSNLIGYYDLVNENN